MGTHNIQCIMQSDQFMAYCTAIEFACLFSFLYFAIWKYDVDGPSL